MQILILRRIRFQIPLLLQPPFFHRPFTPNHNLSTSLLLHPLLSIPPWPNYKPNKIITRILFHRYVKLLLKLWWSIISRWLKSRIFLNNLRNNLLSLFLKPLTSTILSSINPNPHIIIYRFRRRRSSPFRTII
ncbi:hypothetical protein MtrunA17_Chr4g0018591 [Medicago truncatula]|uniref:Uncharacterized protein n=1 Tax=Medicago truncatula TaxID=3880 RepID=A0A396I2M4_MEDTR|nr:hypothetical protein MtrunA17_Chr4g0018591 [Medicago truncatula]